MIPGAPHPLLMAGGGDPIDELGAIAHMLRFRSAAAASLSRMFGTPTSGTTFTYSILVKRGALSALMELFGLNAGSPNQKDVRFNADDTFYFIYEQNSSATSALLQTSRVFRDPEGLYHLVLAADSTQATAANRLKAYVDGIQVTAFSASAYPALNYSFAYAAAGAHYIAQSGSGANYFDGELANFCWVDGQALPPTAFGQFHPLTGQWRPKSKAAIRSAVAVGGGPRKGWGANGYFLPFDAGDFSGGVVYDRSQSDTDTTGNNWTLTNINVTTAGPTFDLLNDGTDNVAILNSLNPIVMSGSGGSVLSAGNLQSTGPSTSNSGSIYPSTITVNSGKWYVEATIVTAGTANSSLGIIPSSLSGGWSTANTVICSMFNSTASNIAQNGAVVQSGLSAWVNGDVCGIAIDLSAGTVQFYRNGVAYGPQVSGLASISYAIALYTSQDSLGSVSSAAINYGQRQFSYPQAGFKALSAKNLSIPRIPNPSTAYVAATDSGANIQATLAALRSGWSNYIEIFRSRGSEGWRWRFSDDLANCIDSSSSGAKTAFPVLAGASYVAYALKVSAANGIATGRLNHVNGTADTVVDGLGQTRKAVILFNEAGSNWYCYHPELTAGKLLYLNLSSTETTDASISGVTSNGFTVAAALPSGTYRWISLAELDGFIRLASHAANNSADGPYVAAGMAVGLAITKSKTGIAGDCEVHDTTRDKANPSTSRLWLNTTGAETSNVPVDLLSSGWKARDNSTNTNSSGATYADIFIAAAPFRYANAR
jgi:hypothetical protein